LKALRSAWKISPMQIAQSRNRNRNLRLNRNPSPHRSLNQNLALSKNQNRNRSRNRAQNLSLNPSPRLNPARKTEQLSHLRSFPRWKNRPRLQKRYSTCRQQKPLELVHLRQSRSFNLSPHQHRNLNSHRHLLRPPSLHQSQAQMNHP